MSKKLKYIVFKINDTSTEIVVDTDSSQDDEPSYENFLLKLPEDQPRWAVYDLEFKTEEGGLRNKICFYAWSPDDARIKLKMVYASSKDALRKALEGVQVDIQATSSDEVDHSAIVQKASRGGGRS